MMPKSYAVNNSLIDVIMRMRSDWGDMGRKKEDARHGVDASKVRNQTVYFTPVWRKSNLGQLMAIPDSHRVVCCAFS